MEWTDTALILRVGKFREHDMWVRLLARRQGLTTAFAFGASKSKQRFIGCLDLFNTVLVRASTSRNGAFLNLNEATLLSGPNLLRTDWQRQGIMANCLRFSEAMEGSTDDSSQLFDLLQSLALLLEQPKIVPAIPLYFRFRLASDQGFAPDLHNCSACGNPLHEATFLVSEGLALCPACRSTKGLSLSLSQESLDVLRKVQENSPEQWAYLFQDHSTGQQCARFIDAFVRYHLGLAWHQGRFQKV